MSILFIGGSGGLGSKIVEKWGDKYGWGNFVITSSKELNVTNLRNVQDFFIEYPEVDTVINMAGISYDKFIHKIGEKDEEAVNRLIDVNVKGAINVAAAALPHMRNIGYGRLIYFSSVLSTNNVLGAGLYGASKAFVDRLVKSLSAENASRNITVNSIQLGYMDGGLTYKLNDPEKFKEAIPVKRWGSIDEIVSTLEYIINTPYLTGANIPLNGGL